jgi:hypothetical protein
VFPDLARFCPLTSVADFDAPASDASKFQPDLGILFTEDFGMRSIFSQWLMNHREWFDGAHVYYS